MKKYFIFAASALALASCSSDDFLGEGQGNGKDANTAINFSSASSAVTRADNLKEGSDAATVLGNNFVVVGFKGSKTDAANNETFAFDHYNVNYKEGTAGTTDSNTKGWEYVGQGMNVNGTKPAASLAQSGAKEQTIKYWDHSCKSYDFIAFSMGNGTGETPDKNYATPTAVQKDKLATEAYTLTGDVSTLSECYISNMKTVEEADYGTSAVQMTFRHATSKVRMALFETVPGYVINEVKFYKNGAQTSETTPVLTGKFNKEGTMKVYFPTTGTDKKSNTADYNVAHVEFNATSTDNDMTFTGVKYANKKENQIEAGETYLGQTRSEASFCGKGTDAKEYITVLPAENNGGDISLKVDYTLTATDGTNEKIHVTGATATVPANYAKWKPGYAYTYIFKISENTNGSTGGTSTGLTAISFDAVVLEDESNGNQETITTVSDPSITTYGFKDGKVTTGGNEYENGTDIYATVFVPATTGEGATPAKTVAPQKLYIVSIQDGAAQTINEASVANAIAKGSKDNDDDPKTWTVTDANGKKMFVSIATTKATNVNSVPAEDGHNLEIEALKWTAEGAGTYYAVEYTDTAGKKTYKIVKISE